MRNKVIGMNNAMATKCIYCDDEINDKMKLNDHWKNVHFICLLCLDKPQHSSMLALVEHEWFVHPSIFITNATNVTNATNAPNSNSNSKI